MWVSVPWLTTSSINVPAPGSPGQLMQWGAGAARQAWPLHTRAQASSRASSPEQTLPATGLAATPGKHKGGSSMGARQCSHPSVRQQQDRGLLGYQPLPERGKKQNLPAGSAGRAWCQRAGTGLQEQPTPGFAAGDRKSALSSVIRGRRSIAQPPPGTPRGQAESGA